MRKPDFCILYENKDEDQLRSNCTADLCLCSHRKEEIDIFLLSH